MSDEQQEGLAATEKHPEGGDPVKTESTASGSSEARLGSFTRRALVQAGWTVPVVLAIKPPAFAQFSPNHEDAGGHGDSPPHSDGPGVHQDINPNHGDIVVPHIDN